MLDADGLTGDDFDARTDVHEVGNAYRGALDALDLNELLEVDCVLSLSASYGLGDPHRIAVHAEYLLDRWCTLKEQAAYVESLNRKVGFKLFDAGIYTPEHLIFATAPRLFRRVQQDGRLTEESIHLGAPRVHMLHVGQQPGRKLSIPEGVLQPQESGFP